jgi:crotonobetainyl-CoA:carnitine CoA-transferase CaiB-like acyl-CoA transferase
VSIEHFDRNKRGIVLDLRNPKSRPVLERLVRRADVALTSFLPDARQRLRIDVEHLSALNPAIIYARGSGYGPRGPDAGAGGFDAESSWSLGGVAYRLSPPEGPLTMPCPALGDGPCGMSLAGGNAAALARRALTGEPSVVDVSLLAGAVWTLAPDLNGYLAPRPGHPVAQLASSPVQFDQQPVRFARAAPRVGEHTAELLAELGFAAGEQRELAESGVLA